MNLVNLSLLEQLMFVLAALALFISFTLLAHNRLIAIIYAFAWQGTLVSAVTALVAYSIVEPGLYFSAALTFSLKGLLIPWMLLRMLRRLDLDRDVHSLGHPILITLAGAALVVFSYWVVLPIEQVQLASTRNIIAVSLAVVLLGMMMMVVRSQVVVQVIGFMSMENGVFLAAVSTTHGMPLVVELGVAFDVMVAAVLFGIFFLHIRENIDSFDVDRLNRLSEVEDEP